MLTQRSGRVRAAHQLTRGAARTRHRLFLAEGAKALSSALSVTSCVVEVFATSAASTTYADAQAEVRAVGVPWRIATDDAVVSLSGTVTPQGVVAVCRFLDVTLESVVGPTSEAGHGVVAVCADVRDPGNAGTMIRTADAAGAAAVVLTGNSVDLYNDKTVRATAGSLFHLPIALTADPAETVRVLQKQGYVVLAAAGTGEIDLFEATRIGLLDGQVAWLFGNEAWGLPGELAALADHRVSIPILGKAESLNLATAGAVCLYASAARTIA
ncbi:MAG: RNA methyltransferase [Actinomycetota bacterium]|nr:RNA methyltransferase [Actinomycetota bacterium]